MPLILFCYFNIMDRDKITKDILRLVDASPMSYVDIAPIIEKYTEDVDYEIEGSIRVGITQVLRELQINNEIDYNKNAAANINISAYRRYEENSLLIRSTYKRQKEIESKKEEKEHDSIKIVGNVTQSVIGNQSLDKININPTTHTTNNIEDNTITKRSVLSKLLEHWYWIAGILIGLLALIMALKKC